jgi:N-acetylneuraminic acid mutarotase
MPFVSGQPWWDYPDFDTNGPGDLSTRYGAGSLPATTSNSTFFVTNGIIYWVGGMQGGSTAVDSIRWAYTSDVGSWTWFGTFPVAISRGKAILTKYRVYIIGIKDHTNSNNTYTYYDTINQSTGEISGTWTRGPDLPGDAQYSCVAVTLNQVYLLGAGYGDAVYTASVDESGVIGSWSTAGNLYNSVVRRNGAAFIAKNYLYFFGGATAGDSVSDNMHRAPFGENGIIGTWELLSNFPKPLINANIISIKDFVYIFGGVYVSYNSTIYKADINSDGSLGSWTNPSGLLYISNGQQQYVIANNNLYTFGGFLGAADVADIYRWSWYTAGDTNKLNMCYIPDPIKIACMGVS